MKILAKTGIMALGSRAE